MTCEPLNKESSTSKFGYIDDVVFSDVFFFFGSASQCIVLLKRDGYEVQTSARGIYDEINSSSYRMVRFIYTQIGTTDISSGKLASIDRTMNCRQTMLCNSNRLTGSSKLQDRVMWVGIGLENLMSVWIKIPTKVIWIDVSPTDPRSIHLIG